MIAATEFFVGPAIIVDDKIDQAEGGMSDVLDQLAAVGMPVVRRTELPPDNEIDHWRGFSLIVLDWELSPVDAELAGIAIPDSLSSANAANVADFVEKLLMRLYCPIFILTNEDVEEIQSELASRLSVEKGQIESRVLVRSKSGVSAGLFDTLVEWLREHPAAFALKSWELGYEEARRRMFADFELSSADWPRILWAASVKDGTNPNFELSETISRNILHRFEPLVFDGGVLDVEGDWSRSKSAIRQVVHRSAVVEESSLHDDVIMPGDFFSVSDKPSLILLNVTPACDLVPRSGDSLDAVSMVLLVGELLDPTQVSSKGKREKLEKMEGSEIIWVLRPDGRPYQVRFKGWRTETWGSQKSKRIGRLLEPYITLVQQRFALHFHRQGLPSLPDTFFD